MVRERRSSVQVQIQLRHVDSRFPKNAQLAIQCMLRHNLAHNIPTKMMETGNAGYLKARSGWRDVRIVRRFVGQRRELGRVGESISTDTGRRNKFRCLAVS